MASGAEKGKISAQAEDDHPREKGKGPPYIEVSSLKTAAVEAAARD